MLQPEESGALTLAQLDSYCRRAELVLVQDAAAMDGGATHLVTLDSSTCPFYAEGGGQPSDHGTVNGLEVLSVANTADGRGVRVQLREPLEAGARVVCEVDWGRRFDLMQQHSGQHLLSAVADKLWGAETVRWELGKEHVFVSLVSPQPIGEADLAELEAAANQEIRASRGVSCASFAAAAFGDIPFRRGLPKGAASNLAELRVVMIDGLDSNPCGGTHVRNLSELQCMKLLGMDKDREATRLRFIVGDRVLRSLGSCMQNEAKLTSLLTAPPRAHADAVERLLADKRAGSKERKLWADELAAMAARGLAQDVPASNFIAKHIPGADLPFLQTVSDLLFSLNSNLLIFLSGDGSVAVPQVSAIFPALPAPPTAKVKKAKGADLKKEASNSSDSSGAFVLVGQPDKTAIYKDGVMGIVQGKGGGRPGKVQGTFDAAALDIKAALSAIDRLVVGPTV